MSLSVSKIQNEPIPVPASIPSFKGNNCAKLAEESAQKLKPDFANIINSSTTGVVCFALLMGLLIFGWISGCAHRQDRNVDKTETPANISDPSTNTINIDA